VKPLSARELGEPKRRLRVRHDLRAVVLEPGRLEARPQRIRFTDADPIPPVQVLERESLGRILGMQVEREPVDVGVELAP
jgi:hypothetical protein